MRSVSDTDRAHHVFNKVFGSSFCSFPPFFAGGGEGGVLFCPFSFPSCVVSLSPFLLSLLNVVRVSKSRMDVWERERCLGGC